MLCSSPSHSQPMVRGANVTGVDAAVAAKLLQIETLNELARVMRPGAELRFASDDGGYVAWTLEHMLAHQAFAWVAERPQDWLSRPGDWPATRYEQKALHGTPSFLRFARAAPAPGLANRCCPA